MDHPRQEGEIHRADPAFRRQMWIWLAVTVVAGAVMLVALYRWLEASRAGMAFDHAFTTRLQWLTAALGLMLATASAAFGLWLHRLAQATQRDRRWPPSTMRTSTDIRIRYLTSADALVAQFRAGSFALFALAAALAAWAAWLVASA